MSWPRATCGPYGDEAHEWWVASDLSELATGQPLRDDHVLGIGGASTTLASWTVRPTRRPRARPRHRLRRAGAAPRPGTPRDRRHRHLRARPGVRRLQRRCSTRSELATLAAGSTCSIPLRDSGSSSSSATRRSSSRRATTGSRSTSTATAARGRRHRGRARPPGRRPCSSPAASRSSSATGRSPAGRTWRDVWCEWLDEQAGRRRPRRLGRAARVAGPGRVRRAVGARRRASPARGRLAAMYAAWLRRLRLARRRRRSGSGSITLQRPATDRPTWRRLDEAHGPVAAPMGPTVDAGLRARTWLAEHSDDDLLDIAWSCAATSPRSGTAARRRGPERHPRAAGWRAGPRRQRSDTAWRHTSAWPTAS